MALSHQKWVQWQTGLTYIELNPEIQNIFNDKVISIQNNFMTRSFLFIEKHTHTFIWIYTHLKKCILVKLFWVVFIKLTSVLYMDSPRARQKRSQIHVQIWGVVAHFLFWFQVLEKALYLCSFFCTFCFTVLFTCRSLSHHLPPIASNVYGYDSQVIVSPRYRSELPTLSWWQSDSWCIFTSLSKFSATWIQGNSRSAWGWPHTLNPIFFSGYNKSWEMLGLLYEGLQVIFFFSLSATRWRFYG